MGFRGFGVWGFRAYGPVADPNWRPYLRDFQGGLLKEGPSRLLGCLLHGSPYPQVLSLQMIATLGPKVHNKYLHGALGFRVPEVFKATLLAYSPP